MIKMMDKWVPRELACNNRKCCIKNSSTLRENLWLGFTAALGVAQLCNYSDLKQFFQLIKMLQYNDNNNHKIE